ncbi:MAG: sulfotransferase [Halieaceae bacterium]|nr:sulfotransferase [Halieaceae bacterium]
MISTDQLIRDARDAAGLDDFGELLHREGFEVLIDSVNRESNLTEQATEDYKARMLRLLVNLLRTQHDLTQFPEILDQPIEKPVFISCLPRTGSTKLHRMLCETGKFQALQFWEGHNPGRIPDQPNGGEAARKEDGRRYLEWLETVAPGFKIAHPMYLEQTEEELILFEFGFCSPHPISLSHVPSYVAWFIQQDMTRRYESLRIMLQYLQWQFHRDNLRPWLLKCPVNQGYEEQITTVFPDARFIVTHRNPVKLIPSVCRLLETSRHMYPATVDHIDDVGQATLMLFTQAEAAQTAWRDANPDVPVLDLAFSDINDEGLRESDKALQFLGMEYSHADRDSIRKWIKGNQLEKHGRHKYSLADYGLTEQDVEEQFTEYASRFGAYL